MHDMHVQAHNMIFELLRRCTMQLGTITDIGQMTNRCTSSCKPTTLQYWSTPNRNATILSWSISPAYFSGSGIFTAAGNVGYAILLVYTDGKLIGPRGVALIYYYACCDATDTAGAKIALLPTTGAPLTESVENYYASSEDV